MAWRGATAHRRVDSSDWGYIFSWYWWCRTVAIVKTMGSMLWKSICMFVFSCQDVTSTMWLWLLDFWSLQVYLFIFLDTTLATSVWIYLWAEQPSACLLVGYCNIFFAGNWLLQLCCCYFLGIPFVFLLHLADLWKSTVYGTPQVASYCSCSCYQCH
jgi:hypothetical protein